MLVRLNRDTDMVRGQKIDCASAIAIDRRTKLKERKDRQKRLSSFK